MASSAATVTGAMARPSMAQEAAAPKRRYGSATPRNSSAVERLMPADVNMAFQQVPVVESSCARTGRARASSGPNGKGRLGPFFPWSASRVLPGPPRSFTSFTPFGVRSLSRYAHPLVPIGDQQGCPAQRPPAGASSLPCVETREHFCAGPVSRPGSAARGERHQG